MKKLFMQMSENIIQMFVLGQNRNFNEQNPSSVRISKLLYKLKFPIMKRVSKFLLLTWLIPVKKITDEKMLNRKFVIFIGVVALLDVIQAGKETNKDSSSGSGKGKGKGKGAISILGNYFGGK